jgi:uncharacterized protein (DUF885 family)
MQLATLCDAQWQHQVEQDILARSEVGLPLEHLPDPTFAQVEQEAAFAREMLARAAAIDAEGLTEDERISLAILQHGSRLAIEAPEHFWPQFQVTPYASRLFPVHLALAAFAFDGAEDLERYLRLVDEYPAFVDGLTSVLLEQQRRGILLPKPELPLVRASLRASSLIVDDARLSTIAPQVRAAFVADLDARIATKTKPAIDRLLAVLTPEYEAAAPEAVGMAQYPGGREAYQYLIRFHTTLNLTPEEIHQTGLAEVARLARELQQVREQLGHEPRLFARSADEIGARLTACQQMLEPKLDRLFSVRPRATCDVRRVDASQEEEVTFGYYQAPTASDPVGHYYYNGSTPEERSLLPAAALIAHELAPGHHFQIARQIDNEAIPLFRRKSYDVAFVEGWGEYAAMLGEELGAYDDPYDRYGRLVQDMMLSCRLVVDTGMNALGWSRDQAIAYLREHTVLSETEIATETLRYAVDIPAHALAYKIGSAAFIALRHRANAAGIDPRDFHEWILCAGSMPLPVLEEYIGRKIDR